MITIDLNDFFDKKQRVVLARNETGKKLAKDTKIKKHVDGFNTIEIILPKNCVGITIQFIDGFFGDLIYKYEHSLIRMVKFVTNNENIDINLIYMDAIDQKLRIKPKQKKIKIGKLKTNVSMPKLKWKEL